MSSSLSLSSSSSSSSSSCASSFASSPSSSSSSRVCVSVVDLQQCPSPPLCVGASFPFVSSLPLDSLFSSAHPIHRQLRPHLPDSVSAYRSFIDDICKSGTVFVSFGCVAETVVGICVWRILTNTFVGTHIYVDDLVTDEKQRSLGVGHTLLEHVRQHARRLNLSVISLDSGTHRTGAHKFYFREGLTIRSFHFTQQLEDNTKSSEPAKK